MELYYELKGFLISAEKTTRRRFKMLKNPLFTA